MDYIENYTSGIQRIVSEYDGFPLQPKFYISDVLFRVTLYNKNYYYDQIKLQKEKYSSMNATDNATENATVNATVNATGYEILDLMKRDRNVTLSELAEITSKHRVTIARNIRALCEAGLIERVGSRKTGYWRVL